MDEKGFKIQGTVYPYVPVDEWLNRDFIFAKKITQGTLADLFGGRIDQASENMALGGIAFWHAAPALDMDKIVEVIGMLKPSDIEPVGFAGAAAPAKDGEKQVPPALTPASDSFESSEPLSERATPTLSQET